MVLFANTRTPLLWQCGHLGEEDEGGEREKLPPLRVPAWAPPAGLAGARGRPDVLGLLRGGTGRVSLPGEQGWAGGGRSGLAPSLTDQAS